MPTSAHTPASGVEIERVGAIGSDQSVRALFLVVKTKRSPTSRPGPSGEHGREGRGSQGWASGWEGFRRRCVHHW